MYMSKFKKITAIMFAVFFFALSPSMWSFAAEGTLQFSDPTGKVGEEVTVKVKIDAAGAANGSFSSKASDQALEQCLPLYVYSVMEQKGI